MESKEIIKILNQTRITLDISLTAEQVEELINDLVDYLKHHIPIIIEDEFGWCNADISLENNKLIVRPNYNIPFED